MTMLGRALAIAAGIGATAGLTVGATVLVKKHRAKKAAEAEGELAPEEGAEDEALDADEDGSELTPEEEALRAEAEAKTAQELEAAAGNPLKTALARIKGFFRRHILIKVEAEEPEEGPAGDAAPEADAPADDTPPANPVEAAPSEAPLDADGKLDVSKLASPEDFADWDDQGCKG